MNFEHNDQKAYLQKCSDSSIRRRLFELEALVPGGFRPSGALLRPPLAGHPPSKNPEPYIPPGAVPQKSVNVA